jgi:hypothetical protein
VSDAAAFFSRSTPRSGGARGSLIIQTTVPVNASAPSASITIRVVFRRAWEVAPRKNSDRANSTVCRT